MTQARFLVRSILVALVLVVVQAVAHGLIPGPAPAKAGASLLPYVLLSNWLVALVLVRLAERSPAAGVPLLGLLLAVTFGIPALYLLETVIFDIGIPQGQLPRLYLQAFVTGVGGAALAATAVGKLKRGVPGEAHDLRAVPLRPGRVALSAFAYVFVYFAAGIMAWPFLRPYYEGRPMPAGSTVLALQVVRGVLLSLLVWLVARHEARGLRPAALTAGLCLSVVGGIAPLLIPGNPYLPDAARHAHLVEVGISNFLFGVVATFIVGRGARPSIP